MAQQQTSELHTFAIGLEGAPDLEFAGVVAGFIGSRHHEHRPTRKDLVEILPQVIYHLESFDALLVRSSMVNFLAGKMASDYAPVVFSGEGSDELFAGYDYLQGVTASHLAEELLDLTLRLHNTALQRVDRCSRAHGLRAYLPFLDREVVSLALRIPTRYKLSPATGMESKWILRAAMEGLLPSDVLHRPKAKFWEAPVWSSCWPTPLRRSSLTPTSSESRSCPTAACCNRRRNCCITVYSARLSAISSP